jgi:CheY-like chemotaxis protein
MEAIGQLTGGIAHDFNNLLMAILGSLEIAQRRMNADPRISPFLDNAVKGAQRGAALTQRMLAFARRQELAMGPVDVLDTVRGMNDILERALGPSIFVTTNFPLSLPPVRTDKAQLESALLNLAVNARDAMPAGGPIAIAAQRRAAPQGGIQRSGDYVVLSVADIGEGMDEETLARATEPFFTTKGVGKGTGLGLSMVHGLAEQSGGTFLLKSEKGHGTTAELWLPLAPGTSEAAGNSTSAAVSGTTVPKRVLVVDDDFLVLLNTVTMLEDLGHQVIEASSGEEALAVLEREPVDLLVTDYAMPRMSGGELAMMARARNPTLKVLVATGYAEMPDEHRGRFERLGKPFSENDLGSAIERALQS